MRQGVIALDHLVALATGVPPGVEEPDDAVDPVLVAESKNPGGQHDQDSEDEHIPKRGVAGHDHRHRRRADDDRRPQVGLKDHEAAEHTNGEHDRDQEVAESGEKPVFLLEEMSQDQDDRDLGHLGWLKAETCDRQPPLRATDDRSHRQHRNEQTDGDEEAGQGEPAIDAVGDPTRDQEGDGADPDAHELSLEEVEAVLGLVDGDR